jgi:hypothetical protein
MLLQQDLIPESTSCKEESELDHGRLIKLVYSGGCHSSLLELAPLLYTIGSLRGSRLPAALRTRSCGQKDRERSQLDLSS